MKGFVRTAIAVAVVCGLAASGCATARRVMPGSLSGEVEDGRYVAPDGSFSVGAPHSPQSYEFEHMVVRDGDSADESVKLNYVIFGPGPTDPSGYHVIVATSLRADGDPRPLSDRANAVMSSYMDAYDATYDGRYERLVWAKVDVGGYPGVYSVYRYEYDDAGVPSSFYVAFTVSRVSDHHLVNVMAEKLSLANPWYPGMDMLVAGEWSRFNNFAASVRVGR